MGTLKVIRKNIELARATEAAYRRLREHLDQQPVGYPSTRSGVEIRLLKVSFTPQEAEVALALDWQCRDFDDIRQRARSQGRSDDELRALLRSMESKGSIFVKRDGDKWLCVI